ncbi:hypothetical protein TSUD_38200 [Trifolium subterraneum]|uniref:Uncharacterized protein n=1 Tax=Trifolium subterraneum TaxID=3900 RepID=A0A2Z6P9T7_TRISU|nr:hypothetical protein TSUD_38200 [Trifolium subterraneum]
MVNRSEKNTIREEQTRSEKKVDSGGDSKCNRRRRFVGSGARLWCAAAPRRRVVAARWLFTRKKKERVFQFVRSDFD